MQSTSTVGNAEHAGSQNTLARLRPYEIALLQLPGQHVTVMDASDTEFQAFVTRSGLIIESDDPAWSFDDKCRLINHARKYGLDLFATSNENSSQKEPKQFANNSQTIPDGELFDGHEASTQAILATIGDATPSELRDDIDQLIEELKTYSESEHKE